MRDYLKPVKRKASEEFEDSADATGFMETLKDQLESGKLMNWAQISDKNFDCQSVAQLKKAIEAYDTFMEIMYSAGEE